ncbi:MAG: hypothetical protein WCF54_21325, partial [Terracidiphilus sp.]
MSIDETPINEKESGTDEPIRPAAFPSVVVRGSRWVDYDTHELLQMISELEDERRWARLREGIWIALIFHALLIAAIMVLPRYIKGPPIVESELALKEHKEFTYLDTPKFEPKVEIKPVPIKPPQIDQQTLNELKKETPPAPEPAPAPVPTAPPPPVIPPSPQ